METYISGPAQRQERMMAMMAKLEPIAAAARGVLPFLSGNGGRAGIDRQLATVLARGAG